MLDVAWEQGIRHFDAARSYGLAEEFLGGWLRDHPGRREQVTIGSKWGYTYVGDWRLDVDTHEVKDHSLATFERQWPETLAALGGPPDFYLVHSVTPDSPVLGDADLLASLTELKSGGVRVGFSTSGPAQGDVVRSALLQRDSHPFSAVQSTWNPLEPSAGDALADAAELGWHVALKETVANGRLTWRGDAGCELAERIGTSPDALAVAAALDTPASVVLVGPSTEDQLSSNLAGRELRLDESALIAVGELQTDPADYWSARSDLPWT
jgi:aryl-alcohol dehydrogenase-like predicted oxidoreductase